MDNLNEFLDTAKMWKVWLFSLVLIWVQVIVYFLLFDLLLDGKITMIILPASFIVSLLVSILVYSSVIEGRRYTRFYEVAKPLKLRAMTCESVLEMDSIKSDLDDFYSNHSDGKVNDSYLNEIVNILELKQPLLK